MQQTIMVEIQKQFASLKKVDLNVAIVEIERDLHLV